MELQWPLILFTLFVAWSAGLFGAQAIASLKGVGKKGQMISLITTVVLLVIGGIAVFFHLQHWERIFNGFGHITSGITQELIGIVVLVVVAVLYFIFLRRSEDGGSVPKWLSIVAIIVAVALVAVMGHSYNMSSRPAWNSIFQILGLVGNACILGPATFALICALKKDEDTNAFSGKGVLIGAAVNAVLSVVYLIVMGSCGGSFSNYPFYFDPTHPTYAMVHAATSVAPFSGDALPFTIATIAAVVIAIVAGFLGKKSNNWKVWGTVAVVCGVAGAVCLRVVFYMMGVSMYAVY
jgi:DMSO reductase anchor subunit